jgi:hypothetical protein
MLRIVAIVICSLLGAWQIREGIQILNGKRKRIAQRGGWPAVVVTRANRPLYVAGAFFGAAIFLTAALYNVFR